MTTRAKRILLPVIILAVAAAIYALMMNFKKPPAKKAEKNDAPFVSTQTVQLQPFTVTVKSQGLVKPKFDTQLLAQVSGEVVEVSDKFVKGGLAKKGELLAQIDPFNYQVKLQQANATLAGARAQFVLARAQGQVAEAEWKNITNAQPSELGLRKPQQEQALAAVKAAEAGVKQAQKDLARTKILAPFDALVTARNVSPGSFVNIGAHLGNVVNVETAEIRLPVPSSDLAFLVNNGIQTPVTLTGVVGGKPHSWQASIVRDEGVIDDKSRMVYLVAQVADPYLQDLHQQDSDKNTNQHINQHINQQDNPQKRNPVRLPFGTYVTAAINGVHLNSVATVPRHLLKDGKLALFSNNTLFYADVEIVRHDGEHSIITGGLSNGDQIITSSLPFPVDGMALRTEATAGEHTAVSTREPAAETAAPGKES